MAAEVSGQPLFHIAAYSSLDLSEDSSDMTMIFDVMTAALNALPWFVLFFPLVQAILAVICIKMFRQQVRH